MKTTKRTSLNKRIAKLNFAKNSIVGNMITNMNTGEKLRPVYSQGSSWAHSTLVDKTSELKRTLDSIGIEYVEGNDAARGGRTGKFIQVTTKIID